MDYKEKYEMALEGIQEILGSGEDSIKMSRLQLRLQGVFPELKESEDEDEDEKIRKSIIAIINNYVDNSNTFKSKMIAWLEKQGGHANFLNNIQIGDKVTRNEDGMLVNLSQLKRVAKKPANKVEPKFKVGDKIYLKPEHRMPDDDTPIADTIHEIIAIDDKHYRFEGSFIFIEDQDKFELVEQKPANKDEPEFHEGDWVVYKHDVCQIVKREEGCNKLVTAFGIEKELVNERNLSTARLWTIQDAKDGDVLEFVDHGRVVIGIISFINEKTGEADVSCLLEDNKFKIGNFYALDTINPCPATKEQRDALMKAMTDAGYIWDAKSKRLLSLKAGLNYTQNPAWSEEDENLFRCAIDAVEQESKVRTDGCLDEEVGKMVTDWLKSLKDRHNWKPSNEQMEILKYACGGNYVNLGILESLYQDLKKLKQ